MPSVFKHADCPACGHRHHFSFLRDDVVTGQEYDYLCPETGKPATLQPTTAAEIVHSPPQGAVALTAKKAAPASQGIAADAANSQATATSDSEAGPKKLEEVLPGIKDLAAKVGGMEHLSDIVETLKQPKE